MCGSFARNQIRNKSANGCDRGVDVHTVLRGDLEHGQLGLGQPLLVLTVECYEIVERNALLAVAIPHMNPLERGLWTGGQMNNPANGELLREGVEPALVQGPLQGIDVTPVAQHLSEDEAVSQDGALTEEDGGTRSRQCALQGLQAGQNGAILECVGPTAFILVEEFEEILALGVLQGRPCVDRLVHHLPLGDGGADTCEESRLACADIAVEGDDDGG